MPVSFQVAPEDARLIRAIAERAVSVARAAGDTYPILDATMDVTAVHANGNPLKLTELLDADGANFAHDVFGIRRHLDRETGTLRDCFVPRFSRPQES